MSRSRWRNELKAEGAEEEEKSIVVEVESNEVNCREAAREEEKKKGDGDKAKREEREGRDGKRRDLGRYYDGRGWGS